MWQNVKYRVAWFTDFTQNFSRSFLQSAKLVWERKAWSKKYRQVAHRDIPYLLSEKVFFVLGFVLGGINSENFFSWFSLIYRTVWTSIVMVTKQNHWFIRHSPSSCSAVLTVVSDQVKALVFKSKWLRSLILAPLDMTVNQILQWKSSRMFWKIYMASPTLKQSCKLFGQNTRRDI